VFDPRMIPYPCADGGCPWTYDNDVSSCHKQQTSVVLLILAVALALSS
jgi:hypothetical protein